MARFRARGQASADKPYVRRERSRTSDRTSAPDNQWTREALESPVALLRVQLDTANRRISELHGLFTEERLRTNGLHIDLADGRTAAMISGCEAAACAPGSRS